MATKRRKRKSLPITNDASEEGTPAAATGSLAASSTRRKRMLAFAIEPDLLTELDEWRNEQELVPPRTRVIEAALRRFLAHPEQP